MKDSITTRQIMTTDVITVAPDMTISAVSRVLHENGITGVPVVGPEGILVGVVSEKDIVRARVIAEETSPIHTDVYDLLGAMDVSVEEDPNHPHYNWVEEIMTRDVVTVRPDATVEEVCKVMFDRHCHRLPVVEDNRVIGIVTTIDVLRLLAQEAAT